MALSVFTALKNGQGGLDWAGLPVLAEYFGVSDMAGLMHRLLVIKSYRKPGDRAAAAN